MEQFQISGTLTADDQKQHIPHEFIVPTNAKQLIITFDYAPKRAQGQTLDHEISLSLFAPSGARGARHNHPDLDITLTNHSASPGYTVGPLEPGTWMVFIDTHRVLPPDPIEYSFTVTVSFDEPTTPPTVWPQRVTPQRGPGWYRGDLHAHTFHSDAPWDVPDLADFARRHHLDFVTLTDHNTVSGLAHFDSLSGPDLLTMGGIELTTFNGHALALGTREWVEWRARDRTTMTDLARAALDQGAFFVIAHPMSIGDPYCCGCDWGHNDMKPGISPAVEVWNGPWPGDSNNEAALQTYFTWLNSGHKLVATAGTDNHGAAALDPHDGLNVVWAEALTEAAILDGIRRGHAYLSSGPALTFTAEAPTGETAMMGDTLTANNAQIRVGWSRCAAGDVVELIHNGSVAQRLPADGADTATLWAVQTTTAPDWYAAAVRDRDGNLRAFTNPIFFKAQP
ncbi:MAG: CehA/McbA family metallohydrolase [Chloroflexi bacterium]|nr:CehA/McbA family metallohydrolase [Chloroflexota bacterium]